MFRKLVISFVVINVVFGGPEEQEGVKYANECEVCKVLATELEARLDETGKSHDVIQIGYTVDDVRPQKKIKFAKSELRLIESLDGVCERILEYNIHKERKDSTRFSKGMSQTFKTLHGLVDKGVKVELGIPYELWDKPSVEITTMKTQCESLLENYESDIEEWYFKHQGSIPLSRYLCSDRALKDQDDGCLKEKGDTGRPEIQQKETKKTSGKNDKEDLNNSPKKVKEDL